MTLALSPREVKIIKCNGNNLQRNKKKHDVYALQPDYLSQSIVVIGVCFLPLLPPPSLLDEISESIIFFLLEFVLTFLINTKSKSREKLSLQTIRKSLQRKLPRDLTSSEFYRR